MELTDVASEVVLPALRAVFRHGEVGAFQLSHEDGSDGNVWLSVTARGETFTDRVVQAGVDDMSSADWRDRLRSNLVDFVAESTFAWGENRDER
jgi:hypothetical protein